MRRAVTGGAVLAAGAVLLALAIVAMPWMRDTANDLIFDNRSHHVPCAQRPSAGHVRQLLADQDPLVQRIRATDPGRVSLTVDTGTCAGRADVTISYGSHADRVAIEHLVSGSPLAGLPLNWRNV